MTGDYRIGPFAGHDRTSFYSGSQGLDRYFREHLSQDIRRRVANCFVAIGPSGDIAGFYTLAATSVPLDMIAPERARRLPRHALIPAVLLGRLAIAKVHQGKHLGAALVADALLRSAHSEIAAHLMVVEAKDEKAARFYEHLEFERLADGGNRLVRAL
jgi:GNAT superfamily N-acetyltransferase